MALYTNTNIKTTVHTFRNTSVQKQNNNNKTQSLVMRRTQTCDESQLIRWAANALLGIQSYIFRQFL